jgi:hypothetical protein
MNKKHRYNRRLVEVETFIRHAHSCCDEAEKIKDISEVKYWTKILNLLRGLKTHLEEKAKATPSSGGKSTFKGSFKGVF